MRWKGIIPAGLPAMILLLAPACAADPLEDCKVKCQEVNEGVKNLVTKYNDVLNKYEELESKFKEFKDKYEQCKEKCKEANIDTSVLDLPIIDNIEREIHSTKSVLKMSKEDIESASSMLEYTNAKLEDICKVTQGNEKLRAQILNGFDGLLVVENGQLTVKSYGHGLLSAHRELYEMLERLNSPELQSALDDATKVIRDAIDILNDAIKDCDDFLSQIDQAQDKLSLALDLRGKLDGKMNRLRQKLLYELNVDVLANTASTLRNSAYDVAQLVTAAWIRTEELKAKERKGAPATWGLLALGCLTLVRRLQRRGRR